MRSQSSRYARVALKCVREANKTDYAKEYGRLCLLFPSLVMINGLRMAVAFFQSKSKQGKEYERFLQDLKNVIDIRDWEIILYEMTITDYQELTRRTVKAVVWFKRYAETIIQVESTEIMEVW